MQEACTPSSSPDTAQARPERLVLRITLLANEWGSSKGGLSTINRTLAIHLAKDPHVEVTILVPEFQCGEEHKRVPKVTTFPSGKQGAFLPTVILLTG